MEKFGFRQGSIIGYKHRMKGINNQDCQIAAQGVIDGKKMMFGAVFDGCTGKKNPKAVFPASRSEVGSALLAAFLRFEIPYVLQAKTPLRELPGIIYQRCLGYLNQIARATVLGPPQNLWSFIQSYLMSTIIGFVMDDQQLVVFAAGDGMVMLNDQVIVIDEDNVPSYPAYHLVDLTILGAQAERLPKTFRVYEFEVKQLQRFAISTDGLVKPWLDSPEFIDGIWNYEPQAKAGLQWWLNVEGNIHSRFNDDCTIVEVHRVMEDAYASETGQEAASGAAADR